jgi:phytoene dehydrogenase-like protein
LGKGKELTQRRKIMSTVAVIGAGMGGLVAGNLLAKKGHKVTIFELHTAPGGYAAGFWKKGFYFESGTLSFESSSRVFQVMKDIGVYNKIPFTRQYGRWVFPGLDSVVHSYDELKAALLEAFPAEKEKLDRYFAEVDRMCRALLAARKPGNVLEAIGFPIKLARLIRLFQKYAKTTLPEFTAIYFDRDSSLYRLLKDIGYPEMGAAILGGAVLSFFEDYWTVKTGMQSWSDVLAENFKSLGGELRLRAKVDKIITQNGAAVGVGCGGKEYRADYVLSAGDYKKTFLRLLDNQSLIPLTLKQKIESAPVSEGFFTVYLGLDIPQEKMKDYLKIPHVYYSEDNPEADIHNSEDGNYFEKAWLMLYSPSLLNPDLAPPGKSSLMIQAMAPHKWLNNWGGGDLDVYRQLKDKVKSALIDKASALIPDLRNRIEFEDAATPLTYERYTHNTDGASSAWSWNPRKKFHKSIMQAQIRTPIKNLFISSCWSVQIGGVPSAIEAALQCAKRIR